MRSPSLNSQFQEIIKWCIVQLEITKGIRGARGHLCVDTREYLFNKKYHSKIREVVGHGEPVSGNEETV